MAFWRPDVALYVVVLAAIYIRMIWKRRRAWDSHHRLQETTSHVGRFIAFMSGLLLLYLAQGPLALLAETKSFSAYVTQMLVMTMLLPWLLVFSLPTALLESLFMLEAWQAIWRFFVHPVVALVTFTSVLTIMLLPPVVTAVLSLNWLHMVVTPILFFLAVCFWWPLASPLTDYDGAMTRGRQLFYLAYASNFMMPVIVYLFLSQKPWYSVFAHRSLQTALADQQLGSVIMLVSMYVIYGSLGVKIYSAQDESIWYA